MLLISGKPIEQVQVPSHIWVTSFTANLIGYFT